MTNKYLNELLKIAIVASIESGNEIMRIYENDFKVELKKDNSPLTIADKNANDIIQLHLRETAIPIISEENKQTDYAIRKNWNICWIVDPLDGTKEFINRNGEFTVNIALINNQKPILGVIYVPVTRELFYSNVHSKKTYKTIVDNQFSFENLFTVNKEIKAKSNLNKEEIIIVGSRSHMNVETEKFVTEMKKKYKNVVMVSKGSSLKFCIIAEGNADIYPRFAPTMEWDTAAGQAICEAVGIKVVSTLTNLTLTYNKEDLLNPWFSVYN